jgi:3'-phosphoadenosine 5'-phosphosulfate sulfotransferase (PAPS reductase)/FAD synthetase
VIIIYLTDKAMIDTVKIKRTLKKSEALADIYGCKLNLGFSGGKDSVILKYFADYYGINYVANFNNTQIEQYRGMIGFIKTAYPDVKIIHPERDHSFFELLKKKGTPSLFRRWCCESLKHSSPKLSEYRVNVMGVRGEESRARLERGEISVFGKSKRAGKTLEKLRASFAGTDSRIQCEGGRDKVNIYPVFDLTAKEIFEVIKTEKLIIPDVYYSETQRLGCAFCPFASKTENFETVKTHPNIAKAWLKVLSDEEFQKNRQKNIVGKTNGTGLFYLYIIRSLATSVLFNKGLSCLNEKSAFGETGLQAFERYLNEHVYKRKQQ